MAKYSSASFALSIADTDGAGGTLRALTSYLTRLGDFTVTKGVIDITPFGSSSAVLVGGIFKKYEPFTIAGLYDDTATSGPDAVLNIGRSTNTHTAVRKFLLTIGGSNHLDGDGNTGGIWILDYKRTFNVGEYTGFEATLQLSGTITENDV